MIIYRKHISGAREIFNLKRYNDTHLGACVATCNTCGRSWDDNHITGVTPTPAARCPFEYQHKGRLSGDK